MKTSLFVPIVFLLLTSGCTRPNAVDQPIPIATPPEATQTIVSLPVIQEALSPIPPPAEVNSINRACLKNSDTSGELSLDGRLLLFDRKQNKAYIRDLGTKENKELVNAVWEKVYGSPDKKGYAYLTIDKQKDLTLYFQLSSRLEIRNYRLSKDEIDGSTSLSGWINPNTLALHMGGDQPTTTITLDLKTGQKLEFPPDYPEIYSFDGWQWEFWGRTLYSPDMHYVIYPAVPHLEPHQYVLWDLRKRKEVNSLEGLHGLPPPQWAPNGKSFVVAVLNHNLYEMAIDGTMTELTDLDPLFSPFVPKIRSWKWSPDSTKIAFWLDLYSGEIFIEERLMILNLSTRELVDYCRLGDQNRIITSSMEFSPAPVWSPDGSHLLVEDRELIDQSQLLVIDLMKNTKYKLDENFYPYDWLNK